MSGRQPCIVVVEDDPYILDLVRDALEMEGFEPVGFNRPFAVDTLTVRPALFLFDLMLPGQSGIELAQTLSDGEYLGAPKIAMSASAVMLERARQSGLFAAFLRKPFDLDVLLTTVEGYATA